MFFKFSGSISGELVRYCFCGAAASIVDIGALWSLNNVFGMHYVISAGLAFILAVLVSYFLSVQLIFKRYARLGFKLELASFAAINLVSLIISLSVIASFSEANLLYSKALAIALSIIWNFSVKKLILFNKLNSN